MNKIKERNLVIDGLKGFTIFLVVLGHSIQVYDLGHEFDQNIFIKIIYSFHMPLFIFISGYLAYETIDFNKPIQTIYKKFRSLMIPFFAWFLIFGYFFLNYFKTINLNDYIKTIIKSPDIGLWFLWVLFCCFIILIASSFIYKLRFFKIKYLDILFFSILSYVLFHIEFQYLAWAFTKWFFPFFISAFLINKYKIEVKKYLFLIGEIAFISFPFLIVMWTRVGSPLFIPYLIKIQYLEQYLPALVDLYKYATAGAGIVISYFIVKEMIKTNIFKRVLTWLGRYSLEIYVVQFYLVGLLGTAIVFPSSNIILMFLNTVVTLTISVYFASFYIKQSKILSFLFLGK